MKLVEIGRVPDIISRNKTNERFNTGDCFENNRGFLSCAYKLLNWNIGHASRMRKYPLFMVVIGFDN